ncbi:MAG: hypothetical protein NC318_08600 [Blautia sp.]|nr:hypothetical protein [Lachnoclostridium sp.]MCM1211648.1 hypothetical protein [Blautia sp.]
MAKSVPLELREYKEGFDFLHKKIREVEWELAAFFHGRKAIIGTEVEMLEDQLENYRENISILLEKIKSKIRDMNN